MDQGHTCNCSVEQGHACHWNNKCGCSHHKIVPLLLALLGLTFLLGNLGTLSAGFVGVAWPVLVILIGLQKMVGLKCNCWDKMGKGGDKM